MICRQEDVLHNDIAACAVVNVIRQTGGTLLKLVAVFVQHA